MIRKLFGETEEEQFRYLKPRLIALSVGVVVILIGFLLMQIGVEFGEAIGSFGTLICVVVLLIFGWSVVRGGLGFASLGALFFDNIIIGVIIFVLFLITGYILGIFVALIGLYRFLVLLRERKGNN